jgi:hypothetical protein
VSDFLNQQYARLGNPLSADALLLPRDGGVHANFGYAGELAQYQPEVRSLGAIAPHLADQKPKDAGLWPALFELFPDWHWGVQPTGDCTRWMQQHLLDVLMAGLWKNGLIAKPEAQVAGESIYATAKCELVNSYRYHGAGCTGAAVANASVKYGHLYRRKYSVDGKIYDLTRDSTAKYDNGYSVLWGDRGRGLPDELEPYAAQHKVRDRIDPESPEEAGKLIQAGYPVQFCGMSAPWARVRGDDGLGVRFSSAAHAMCATGVRWAPDGTVLALWIANTGHFNHCTGPVGPIPVPAIYAECGGWVPRKLLVSTFSDGDCKAHSFVEGWPLLDVGDYGMAEILGE